MADFVGVVAVIDIFLADMAYIIYRGLVEIY